MQIGTSEMHFVAALDRVDGMRCVLVLFEGIATGAADGYARMAEKPAATLLHLGPGLANGLANLHNATKASSPIINIVGDHATYHLNYDAPLTSDIEGAAKPFSGWVRTSSNARRVAADGAAAIAAARTPPGQVATLILPADTAWNEGCGPAAVAEAPKRARASQDCIKGAAKALRSGEPAMVLLGDSRSDNAALIWEGAYVPRLARRSWRKHSLAGLSVALVAFLSIAFRTQSIRRVRRLRDLSISSRWVAVSQWPSLPIPTSQA